jgi:two-component system, cell cycle sensor histidine kinase and response regulator CckA
MRLFWKIFAAVLVSFIAVTVLISYVIFVRQLAEAENGIVEGNVSVGDAMSRQVELGYLQSMWPFELLEVLSKRKDFLFWWVVRHDGTIHLADQAPFMKTQAGDYFPHLTKVKWDKHLFLDREQEYGISISPIEIGNRKWSFWLAFSLKDIAEARKKLILFDLVVCLSGIMTLGIILFFIVRHFIKPVKELTLGTAVIAKGDLVHRVKVESADELGQLAQAFNRMAEELQKRDARIRSIFEAAQHVSFIVTDHAGMDARILEFSPGAELIFGYRPEEVIGKPAALLHIAEDITRFPQILAATTRQETGATGELRLVRKSGEEFPALFSSHPICDAAGNVVAALAVSIDISELKRAEEALRIANHFRESIIEHAAEGLCVCHDILVYPFVRFTVWNQRMQEITGYSMEEINRLGWYQTMYPEPGMQTRAQERMARMRGGEDLRDEEWDITRLDGRKATLRISTTNLRSMDGQTHVLALMYDITERKITREALRESEMRYRLLAESATDVIWTVGMDMRLDYVSPSVTRLLGFTVEEAMARTMEQAYSPASFKKAMMTFAEEMAIESAGHGDPNRSRMMELELVHKDGNTVPVEGNFRFLRDSTGEAIGILSIVRDITERKAAEEATLRAKKDWEQTFDAVPDLIAILDEGYQIIRANGAMAAKLGLTPKECLGLRCYEAVHGTTEPPSLCPHRRLLMDGSEHTAEVYEDRLGGDFMVSVSPLFDAGGRLTGSVHVARDITDLKRTEEERIGLERRLQQAQKAESLGRMAGAIAHHFNNLLGVVIGSLELALLDLPKGSKPAAKIAQAMVASGRAAGISRSMLAYLGQSIGTTAPMELSEVCRGALPLLTLTLPKTVLLRTDLPDTGPIVHVDPVQFQQVLTNLVTNAGEAMGDREGEVALAVHVMPATDIRESRFYPPEWEPKDDSYARLSVSDNGIGMDPETLEKAFDPFFSTKFTGRGLGLAVVLGVVKAHNGALTVESAPGRGTVFRVLMPLSAEELPLPRKAELATSVPPENRGLVLLVDDEPMLRDMAQIMFEPLGHEVITAADGVEALEVFRKHQDRVQCVLLDLTMPRMDGWETLAALRALRPDLPVILASGYDEAKVMQGYHPERPQAFLHKPYAMKDLDAALGVALKASSGAISGVP